MGTLLPAPAPSEATTNGNRRSSRVRLLIADETSMGCLLLKSALERSRFRIEVVGWTTSISEIQVWLHAGPVDVIVISESLEGGAFAGFETVSKLQVSFPNIKIIMLLRSATRELVVEAFRAGAEGVVCRTEPPQVLCKCIQTVHKGQIWVNTQQLHFLLEALIRSAPSRLVNPRGRHLLAEREDQVATLVAEGMSNREIARELGVTEHTVSNHLFRIYEKLGISSRVELVLYRLKHTRHPGAPVGAR